MSLKCDWYHTSNALKLHEYSPGSCVIEMPSRTAAIRSYFARTAQQYMMTTPYTRMFLRYRISPRLGRVGIVDNYPIQASRISSTCSSTLLGARLTRNSRLLLKVGRHVGGVNSTKEYCDGVHLRSYVPWVNVRQYASQSF